MKIITRLEIAFQFVVLMIMSIFFVAAITAMPVFYVAHKLGDTACGKKILSFIDKYGWMFLLACMAMTILERL